MIRVRIELDPATVMKDILTMRIGDKILCPTVKAYVYRSRETLYFVSEFECKDTSPAKAARLAQQAFGMLCGLEVAA